MLGWELPPHHSGGLGVACYSLSKALAEEGADIDFVVPYAAKHESIKFMRVLNAVNIDPLFRYGGTAYDSATIADPKFPTPTGQTWSIRDIQHNYCEYVTEYLETQPLPDVVHAHDWLTFEAGMLAKRKFGLPLVAHVHATEFDRCGDHGYDKIYNIERDGMLHADHIITVSNLTRQTVIDKYHIDPAKVTTVHNAVEPLSDEIKSIEVPHNPKEKVVTFLGRITMQKGPEYFVEAAARVLRKTNNVRFVMAGSGDMMNKMIMLSAQRNISDRFHFTGFLRGRQVYEMLKASDVYVMPSVSEPFGISPLEAMQVGVPSIISKQSGCAEILTNVIKIDYWDIDAMADAIYSIITYPAIYKQLREEGEREVNEIKWKYAGQKVLDIYHNVLRNYK